MDPENAAAASADLSASDSATSADSSSESSQERGMSMAEAFAEAAQRVTAEPEGDTEEDSEPESPDVAPSPAAQPEPADEAKAPTDQGTLDRILTLYQQNRLHELPPEARGVADRLIREVLNRNNHKPAEQVIAEHEAAQREEAEFREAYLNFLAEAEEDPAAFARRTLEDPDVAAFMAEYKKSHPNVSLDDPFPAPPGKSEEEIAQTVSLKTRQALETGWRAWASDNGVNYDAIAANAAGKGMGSLMLAVADAVVEARVSKATERIRKEEREAASKEANALYLSRLPSMDLANASRSGKSRTQPGKGLSVAEAMALASER